MTCTGVSAFWCPVCGDCTCARAPDGECFFDDMKCPLHGPGTQHAVTVELEDCRQGISTLAADMHVELSGNDHEELARFAQWLHDRSRKRAEPQEPS